MPTSPIDNPIPRRRHRVAGVMLLALVAAVSTGCGAQTSSAPDGRTTGTTGGGSEPQIATVIRNFQAQPSGAAGVRLTGTLSRGTRLKLVVTRLGGPNPVDIGNVELGRQPAGQFALTWNGMVAGRRPAGGRYRLQLYGGQGDGRSRPVVIRLGA